MPVETTNILLSQCHPDLQIIIKEVSTTLNIGVATSTIRTEEQQKEFVSKGLSKTLNSKHLKRKLKGYLYPYSCAVDFIPLVGNKVDYSDTNIFCVYAGYIMAVANMLYSKGDITHKIRWGGDWNNNFKTTDETLKDFTHIELVMKEDEYE